MKRCKKILRDDNGVLQKRQLISRHGESLVVVFFFRAQNSLESALFVTFCCHFLNFQHSWWNPTLRTPIHSDSFICSNQSNQHRSQTSNDPPGGVPKKDGIWCLIIDLSSLHGSSLYSQLPIIRTFKGNRKTFELSDVRVIEGKIIWKMI